MRLPLRRLSAEHVAAGPADGPRYCGEDEKYRNHPSPVASHRTSLGDDQSKISEWQHCQDAPGLLEYVRVKHDAPDDDIAGSITHNVIIVRPHSAMAFAGLD